VLACLLLRYASGGGGLDGRGKVDHEDEVEQVDAAQQDKAPLLGSVPVV
jgi:hypothetical protein